MLHVSDLLLEHRDIASFEELVEIVRVKSRSEMFFRMDLKPPYPDTPDNWEFILEAAFNEYQG